MGKPAFHTKPKPAPSAQPSAAPAAEPVDEIEASRAPLLDHLLELRNRLIVALVSLAVAFGIAFVFAVPIYNVLVEPYKVESIAFATARGLDADTVRLIATAPLEFFFVKIELAFFGAIILAFPMLAYQAYAFVAPGLYKNEKQVFLPYLVASPVLFGLGASLVYWFILPFVMRFALGQQQMGDGLATIELLPRVSDYLKLVTTLILAFGFSFQMPVILTLLAQAGMITTKMLWGGFRYAIVGIFMFAAFVTPPDPLSQIGLAVPLVGLYLISIWCVRLIEQARARAETEAEAA